MDRTRAVDNVDRRAGAFGIRAMMRDGGDAAEQILGDSHPHPQAARNSLHGRDRRRMTAMNRIAPFDVVAIGTASELFIAIEFKMVVRIDQAGKGERSIEYDFALSAWDHNVANARAAENLDV